VHQPKHHLWLYYATEFSPINPMERALEDHKRYIYAEHWRGDSRRSETADR
jgi:hypothetical protein